MPEQVGNHFMVCFLLIVVVLQAYGNSKAAQIMFGEHLAREIEARGANVKIIRLNYILMIKV